MRGPQLARKSEGKKGMLDSHEVNSGYEEEELQSEKLNVEDMTFSEVKG